jgi:hypothetical protein
MIFAQRMGTNLKSLLGKLNTKYTRQQDNKLKLQTKRSILKSGKG